jgi:probable rRNA maturation factor
MAGSIEVEISDRQSAVEIEEQQLIAAVREVLQAEAVKSASVSIALVDDSTIRELNRRYLDHDYATDVLSFPLECGEDYLEGEIVVSGPMAARTAAEYGWSAADELLLYVVHGCLHLVGYEDTTPDEQRQMRKLEMLYLSRRGRKPRYDPRAVEETES